MWNEYSVALYGCESWKLRKVDECQLAAFEMWLQRRVLRVSWFEKRTNIYVRNQLSESTRDQWITRKSKKRKDKEVLSSEEQTWEPADGDDERKTARERKERKKTNELDGRKERKKRNELDG